MTSPDFAARSQTPGATQEISGREVVLAYSGVRAEYDALQTSAIVVDRNHRGRLRLHGAKAGEALTGLVTNDVLALAPGHGQYGAALTSKGRIVADIRVFAFEGSYLVDTSPRAWPGLMAMVKKYINPRIAGYRDESHAIRDIGVFGPQASQIVSAVTGIEQSRIDILPPYSHVTHATDAGAITVARAVDLTGDGFDVFVPFEIAEHIRDAIIAAGATQAGLVAWDIARVEAGRPEWGIDIDDNTIPQEANFEELDAISFTKGCYIGQEVVARVHFRGHVNRHLRGLRSVSVEPPPTGAQLIDDSGNHVGDVRSAAVSPRLGSIAIGMVRREVEPGTSLTAKWEGGEQRVDVTLLPFPI